MKIKIEDKKGTIHYLKYAHTFYTETQCGQVLDNMIDKYNYTNKELTCFNCMTVIIKNNKLTGFVCRGER